MTCSERLQGLRISLLPHFTEILLADFPPEEARSLIRLKLEQFFGSEKKVSRAFVERIVIRSEGNPFYIEELLNYLQDRNIDPEDTQSLDKLDFPTSLQRLILSRIDQLSENQVAALKVASAIGRLFKAAMLWGVYPQLGEWDHLVANLEALSRLELTAREPEEPELTYLFKHVITQEVTYESLQYATRAVLHEQIARYIEKTYPGALDQYLDLLAFHYEQSKNDEKKREYLLKAGQLAQANYANDAAISYFQRLLPLLPSTEQVPVLLKLGQVLELVGRWAEADDIYAQVRQAAEQNGDHLGVARAQAAAGELHRKQGRYAEASSWFAKAQATFEKLGDEAGVASVLNRAGTVAAQQADFERARTLYEHSLAIHWKLYDKRSIGSLLSNLGIIARLQGDYELARKLHEQGLAIRRDLGDRWGISVSLNNLGNVALDQGDYAEARARLEEALALQREVGDKYMIANALNNLGNVARAQGDTPAARNYYSESMRINQGLGAGWQIAYLLEDIGGLAAQVGQATRAVRLVSAAAALRMKIGAPLSPAEQAKLDQLMEPAQKSLDEQIQARSWSEGQAMSLEQAMAEALGEEPVLTSASD
jgi:predicted ATPase